MYINYYNLAKKFYVLKNVGEETFSIFINNIPPSIKNLFISTNLLEAIKNKNIHLIKYLYNHQANSEKALIEAVKTNDAKIVETVIKYFDFKFINEITEEGTALSIAVEESNLEIVEQLLSIEGIDVNFVTSSNLTALNIAISKQETAIAHRILDFYGENLKDQVSQINESIKIILKPNSTILDFYGGNLKQQVSQINKPVRVNLKYSNPNVDDSDKIKNKISILKRIVEVENVDLNCCEGDFSILSFACKYNERSLVEYL